MDVQGDAQFQILALKILGNGLLSNAVAVVEEVQFQFLSILGADPVASHNPAGLVQKAGRLIGVVSIRLQIHVTVGDGWGIKGIRCRLQAVENALGDGLPVCGVLERLSHRHVSQNIVGGVQHNMPGGGGVRQAYGEPVTVHILADGISVQHVLAENQVDLLILQGHNACLVVGDDLDSDLLNCGRLTPIILIALKNSILIGNKVCEYIRTCPDIAVDAVHRAAVDHAVRGNHCERADASQLGEHGVVRLAHLNDKSIAVRRRNAHQQVHHLQPGVPLPVFQNRVEVGQNGVGVAGCSVGEGYAVPDIEGIDPAIIADGPVLCQTTHITIFRIAHQCIVKDTLGVHLTGVQVGVQVPDIPIVDKYQLVPRSGFTLCVGRASAWICFAPLPAAGERRQQQSAAQQHRKNPSFHKCLQS